MNTTSSCRVLVAGASGYIGGRLTPRLLEAGHKVTVLSRSPEKLRCRPWASHPDLRIVKGDVLEPSSLAHALEDCDVVYYLVHSMNPDVDDFSHTDRIAAENMREAAAHAHVQQIIYLGGLGEQSSDLSHHLRSRAEVGAVLSAGHVPVTVLRAAMIIGSGSASFEILRYLVERLPVMVTPRWVHTPCQPIGVRNVITYLIGCLRLPEAIGGTFDIGQEEIVTYRELFDIFAEEAGLRKRWVVPVPVLTPRLSSYWIHLVTPVPAVIARPLAEGLGNPVVCRENRIRQLIPQQLYDARTAIRLALKRTDDQQIETSWIDSGQLPDAEQGTDSDPRWAGGSSFDDSRSVSIAASAQEVWPVIQSIGGEHGYYYADWLWQIRGWMDRLVGGVGLCRGRRNSDQLLPGDALDFWRVIEIDPPHRLTLSAEMKLPGDALLSFRLRENPDGTTEVRQVARFIPRGLLGLLYWYMVLPFHYFVFNGMLKGIAETVGKEILSGPERFTDGNSGRP